MRKVVDALTFNGEYDILKIRLNELKDVVDYHIIGESNLTYSGLEKKITFDYDHPFVKPFAHKIRFLLIDDMPTLQQAPNAWVREMYQRDVLTREMTDLADEDLVIVNDADEIPKKAVVEFMRDNPCYLMYGLKMAFYYFYFNYQAMGSEHHIIWSYAGSKKQVMADTLSNFRVGVRFGRVPCYAIDHAGWHLSYMMDNEGFKNKIRAFAHQELNTPQFINECTDIQKCIDNNRGLLHNPDRFELVYNPDLPPLALTDPDLQYRFYRSSHQKTIGSLDR